MATQAITGARLFASHYQIVVCDDPFAFTEESNWNAADTSRGFAGNEHFRMIGTEADLNDHWVELVSAGAAPTDERWHRITCVGLRCDSGAVHVMSVVDEEPAMTIEVPVGDYSVYVAGCNLGVDQLSLGEDTELSDEEYSQRKDLEWYRIFVVPGAPVQTGRIKDDAGTAAT